MLDAGCWMLDAGCGPDAATGAQHSLSCASALQAKKVKEAATQRNAMLTDYFLLLTSPLNLFFLLQGLST